MSFDESAYLVWLRRRAKRKEVVHQLSELLSLIGKNDKQIINLLAHGELRQDVIVELTKWNDRLQPSPNRDEIGNAAVQFWVAQTLSTTVMRHNALDPTFDYGPKINKIMELGADGIFELGKAQFSALGAMANNLTDWLKNQTYVSPIIIESPLGNSLPVQVICDFAKIKNVKLEQIIVNTPRNVKKSRGATVENIILKHAEMINNHDLIIYVDDVSTGSRFMKIYDAMVKHFGTEKLLPIGLFVEDAQNPQLSKNINRKRVISRLEERAGRIGYEANQIELPLQVLFRLDKGPCCRWEKALIWEDSDLLAGKRKINLFFTILDHVFNILEDLSATESLYRIHLEQAWIQDVSGRIFMSAPGLTQSVFAQIASEVSLSQIKDTIELEARTVFNDDYEGRFVGAGNDEEFVKKRWDWIREKYLSTISPKIGEARSRVSWRAVDNAFAASFDEHTPRPDRDQAATPYIIPFNLTMRKLNIRLRHRIIRLAQKG